MPLKKSHHRSFYLCGFVLILICITPQQTPAVVEAQSAQWSIPQTIPGYDAETWPPILLADQNRTVHAFSSQWIRVGDSQSARAIVYNRWTLDQGWTTPIDIILSPSKEARLTDAYLGRNGMFHVTFFGGDSTGADIYYSKAPAAIADEAQAWSAPMIIGENAGDPEGAVFVENDQGTLYVVYNGRQLGNGIYVVNSNDSGESWSDPTPIFFATRDEPNISQLHVIKGKSGWLHAVWGVFSITGQGRAIYYTRSGQGSEWSDPVLLANAQDGLGTQAPTIFEHDGRLFAMYITQASGSTASKIMMRLSKDDGKTWGDPSVLFARHQGVNGQMSLVVDGRNDLHLFFGQRIPGDPDIHGLWHSLWEENRWLEPEGIVRGLKKIDQVGYSSFDPNAARAIISQGNVILVTWRTDPGSKGNGVWFSYKRIEAPESPVVQLPTPSTNAAAGPSHIQIQISSPIAPSPAKAPTEDYLQDSPSSSGNVGMIFGGVAVIASLFIIVILVSARKQHS